MATGTALIAPNKVSTDEASLHGPKNPSTISTSAPSAANSMSNSSSMACERTPTPSLTWTDTLSTSGHPEYAHKSLTKPPVMWKIGETIICHLDVGITKLASINTVTITATDAATVAGAGTASPWTNLLSPLSISPSIVSSSSSATTPK